MTSHDRPSAAYARAVRSIAERLPQPPAAWAVDCDHCGLWGNPLASRDQAEQLAARHDDMHHRGQPTAAARPA